MIGRSWDGRAVCPNCYPTALEQQLYKDGFTTYDVPRRREEGITSRKALVDFLSDKAYEARAEGNEAKAKGYEDEAEAIRRTLS
jgi:hypothetical protein